jgi:catechol 2,3-dioxygenase-like lactoylglutathione lyase family enzyme
VVNRAKFVQVAPVLPARDITALKDFYVDKLGFSLAFIDPSTEQTDPRYVGVRRDGVELHLQWHDASDWDNGMDRPLLRLIVDDPDALFAEYAPQGVFHDRTALRNTQWGTREFAFYDPDGNGLIFFRDLQPGERI